MPEICQLCDGTGWMPIEIDGVRSVKPCVCKTRARAEREKSLPGGFEKLGEGVPKLLEELSLIARQVREIIMAHRGEGQAVTVDEIIAAIWPELKIENRKSKIENAVRAVKQAVSDLVTLGRMLIGSSRDPKRPGYFLIETGAELDRQRAHCLQHLRAWVRRFKALDPYGIAARELYGQIREDLEIQEPEVRSQESVGAPAAAGDAPVEA